MDLFDLEPDEIEVLFYRCRDQTPTQIQVALQISSGEFFNRQNAAFTKLAIPGQPKQKFDNFRRKGLCEIVRQLTIEDIRNWYERRAELRKKLMPPMPSPTTNEANEKPARELRQWVDNNRRTVLILVAGLLAFAVGAFLLRRCTIPPPPIPTPTPSATQETPVTETLAATGTITLTAAPTETPTPTLTATQTLTFTPVPVDTQSPFGLQVGEELSDDRVTVALTKAEFYQGYDRIARKIAAINYWFDFTNHSGGTILFRVDGSNFEVTDNLGIEYPCVFEDGVYITPELDKSIENGSSLQILLRCGPNQEFGDDVNEITLTVSGSRDLIESTWVVIP